MKAYIEKNGTLNIKAETELESYALQKWCKQNFNKRCLHFTCICIDTSFSNENQTDELLKPGEVDVLFRYPTSRTMRLVRKGMIPHIELPDGQVRIKSSTVQHIISQEKRIYKAKK